MGRNKIIPLLLLLPLLIPALVFGLRWFQNMGITNYSIGGFKNGEVGERAAMKRLAQVVREGQVTGVRRAIWTVTVLAPKPQQGTTFFELRFEHSYNRLAKSMLPSKSNRHSMVTQYIHVDDTMIYSVAAENGLAEDLIKHGAVLRKQGVADVDEKGRLQLQW